MQKIILHSLVGVALVGALSTTPGCTHGRRTPASTVNSSNQSSLGITASPDAHSTGDTLSASDPVAPAAWSEMEAITFDDRLKFYGGFPFVLSALDGRIAGLAAKRTTLRTLKEKLSWDLAMKEMKSARDQLKTAGARMNSANLHDWTPKMAVAGNAWLRTQAAEQKLRARLVGRGVTAPL